MLEESCLDFLEQGKWRDKASVAGSSWGSGEGSALPGSKEVRQKAEGRRQAELCGQSSVQDSGSPLVTLARTKTSTSPQSQVSLMGNWLPLQPGASSHEGPLEVVSCKLFTIQRRKRGSESQGRGLPQITQWVTRESGFSTSSLYTAVPSLGLTGDLVT